MRIHPFPARPRLLAVVMTLATLLLLLVPVAAYAQANTANGFYQQTNLVSDLPNIAKFQDPNLLNPWGLSHGPTTPWWVSDNGAGVATLYNGGGQAFPLPPSSPLVVTIPPLQVVLLELRQRQPATSSMAQVVSWFQRIVYQVQACSFLPPKMARYPAGTATL